MIERTADICVKNETYQNNLIKTQDTLSKAYQDNLKNLTDTMNINVKIVYLWCCAPGLNVHISESVFVSFVGNSQFQRQKVRYLFPLVHVNAVSPRFCGSDAPYMPSVEFYL